jgi:hypothetical protein
LYLTIVPEPIQDGRKRQLLESGLVDEPMTIKRFCTIRRYAATHQASSILGKRGCRDFPNTVYYSEQYKQAVAAKKKGRQKYTNATFAEWAMGFPRGWTSLSTTAAVQVARAKRKNKRFDAISLFSGVGGIELGMHEVFNTTLSVERCRSTAGSQKAYGGRAPHNCQGVGRCHKPHRGKRAEGGDPMP